ncbi:SRPBCC family protein [Actinocorallia aurantiaca]
MSRTIEQTLHIRARPETVWRFFTDPARLARWWGTAELDAGPGGILQVAMHEGPRPVMRGRFVELVPYERLVFTFGWEATPGAPDIPPESSRVEVTLTPDGDGTELTLRHSDLPTVLEEETGDGWAHLLHRLAETAEPGDQPLDQAPGPCEEGERC